MATVRLGLSWKYSAAENLVTIFYVDTKTFRFYAIPSVTDMTSVVQSGTTTAAGVSNSGTSSSSSGGGISGNSGSSQSTGVTINTDITKDIGNSVQSMLTPGVGRMSMSSSTGTMTVTDTPEVLARVGDFLNGENSNITKQVLLNVKVLSVTLTDKDDLGIDWNLVYKAVNGKWGLGWKNVTQTDAAAVQGSVSILDTQPVGRLELAGQGTGSARAGVDHHQSFCHHAEPAAGSGASSPSDELPGQHSNDQHG